MVTRFLVGAMIVGFPVLGFGAEPLVVDVSVSCEKPTVLVVALLNAGDRTVQLHESWLPWNFSKVLDLEGFKVSEGRSERLRGIAPVSDYLRVVTLEPGKTLHGNLDLASVIGQFERANKSSSIIVSYSIRNLTGQSEVTFDGRSGIILIPQRGYLSQGCPALLHPKR